MDNFVIGKYVNYNSFVHKMDPRQKIFSTIILMVTIFLSFPTWSMTFAFGILQFIFILFLMVLSKTSIRDLFKSLKFMWFMILLILLLNILMPQRSSENEYILAFSIGSLNVYWESIFQSIKIFMRLINMLGITMILISTTKPLDLTYGLEWYMSPLKLLKFPAHEVAMTISIALRFIPTLLEETNRLMKAQESRGIDFKNGSVKEKFRGIVSLIVPLFVSAFQRSEELANAMEARGYDPGAKRTSYHVLSFSYRDLIAVSFILAIFAFALITKICNFDYFEILNIYIPEVLKYGYYIR